jgi:hypothetical protein
LGRRGFFASDLRPFSGSHSFLDTTLAGSFNGAGAAASARRVSHACGLAFGLVGQKGKRGEPRPPPGLFLDQQRRFCEAYRGFAAALKPHSKRTFYPSFQKPGFHQKRVGPLGACRARSSRKAWRGNLFKTHPKQTGPCGVVFSGMALFCCCYSRGGSTRRRVKRMVCAWLELPAVLRRGMNSSKLAFFRLNCCCRHSLALHKPTATLLLSPVHLGGVTFVGATSWLMGWGAGGREEEKEKKQ